MKSDAHHEGFSRDVEVVASTERSFGFVFGGFFTLVSLWPLLRGGLPRWWALGLAVMFVGIALLRPTLSGPSTAPGPISDSCSRGSSVPSYSHLTSPQSGS